MAPVPPANTRPVTEQTRAQTPQPIKAVVGGVQVDVVADIRLNPEVVGVTATPSSPPARPAVSVPSIPARRESESSWLLWMLVAVLLVGFIIWYNQTPAPATSAVAPVAQQPARVQPLAAYPSIECSATRTTNCVRAYGSGQSRWYESVSPNGYTVTYDNCKLVGTFDRCTPSGRVEVNAQGLLVWARDFDRRNGAGGYVTHTRGHVQWPKR